MEEHVTNEIKRRDWVTYFNTVTGWAAMVERKLARTVAQATTLGDMDVCTQLARLAFSPETQKRLAHFHSEYRQIELHLTAPINRPMFVFWDEGKIHLCATPVVPFYEDN
jgi:hypothetical protein